MLKTALRIPGEMKITLHDPTASLVLVSIYSISSARVLDNTIPKNLVGESARITWFNDMMAWWRSVGIIGDCWSILDTNERFKSMHKNSGDGRW